MGADVYAHSGQMPDKSDWQTLADHEAGVAGRAGLYAAQFGLTKTAELAGRLHDFGKNDPAFQRRLSGDTARVDHSTAGAHLVIGRGGTRDRLSAEIVSYAILGHHAGLPDAIGDGAAMHSRLENFALANPIAPALAASVAVDLAEVAAEIRSRIGRDSPQFDLSVVGRMVFSCLVDADFRDTEAFYARLEGRQPDRHWPALAAILPDLRRAFDARIATFPKGGLNDLRSEILSHIRAGAARDPGLYTLTVPTGGGKTLASLGFALDHAAHHGHRRIIYAIPYTSIIEQTAETFRDLFAGLGDVVLEHHSSVDEDRVDRVGRDKLRLAMEDWAAPVVVTTNVQLFESLFAARPSQCRKLHNIAGSVIILDEVQCLPRALLLPVLRMIDTLATQYGCTILLCTATQPAFDSAHLQKGGLRLAGRELAPDPQALARRLRRARVVDGGALDDAALVAALRDASQAMVVVNSRKHALDLFRRAQAEGLSGLVHLTTRQYPAHRRRILADIRERLKTGAPCRLIATSLIEAGVDLDFPCGWRAEAGLDSIVQCLGRVNREGRGVAEDSTLTVFTAPDNPPHRQIEPMAAAMRATAQRFGMADLVETEAITDWFGRVYWREGVEWMGQEMVDGFVVASTGTSFPYRSTAAAFRMIDSAMVPVIVARDASARQAVGRLVVPEVPSGALARALQGHIVQVPDRARAILVANGQARFHAPVLRGNQFCVLESEDLYHEDFGLWWENAEYLSEDQSII